MTTKQYSIADVLHCAADNHLIAGSRYNEGRYKERFSCSAIDEAIIALTGSLCSIDSSALRRRVMVGLKDMGCNTGSHRLFIKHGDKPLEYGNINPEVQGMRYMWLKWAALMAEEQGV